LVRTEVGSGSMLVNLEPHDQALRHTLLPFS